MSAKRKVAPEASKKSPHSRDAREGSVTSASSTTAVGDTSSGKNATDSSIAPSTTASTTLISESSASGAGVSKSGKPEKKLDDDDLEEGSEESDEDVEKPFWKRKAFLIGVGLGVIGLLLLAGAIVAWLYFAPKNKESEESTTIHSRLSEVFIPLGGSKKRSAVSKRTGKVSKHQQAIKPHFKDEFESEKESVKFLSRNLESPVSNFEPLGVGEINDLKDFTQTKTSDSSKARRIDGRIPKEPTFLESCNRIPEFRMAEPQVAFETTIQKLA